MKVSRFNFYTQGENNRETNPAGGWCSPAFPQYFGDSNGCSCRRPEWHELRRERDVQAVAFIRLTKNEQD
jgi:hypothetical protein